MIIVIINAIIMECHFEDESRVRVEVEVEKKVIGCACNWILMDLKVSRSLLQEIRVVASPNRKSPD